ncbi:MAG: hypothetical protein JXB34_12430 [Bacteroidales bacterium]|nr:hypothetical protein [Bacteroidales bacterium]
MKKLLFALSLAAILLVSCTGKKKQTVNNLAGEMCKAMELIVADNPMSMIEAASAMTVIADKPEYKKVTEDELIEAMKTICPEGATKFIEISSSAGQTEEN